MSMTNRLIRYLTQLPDPTTAPLVVALNQPALLAAMGSGVTAVSIYSSHAGTLKIPYVLLQEQPDLQGNTPSMGGGNLTDYLLRVECKARGTSDDEARERADTLAAYVREELNAAREPILTGAAADVFTRSPLPGTSATFVEQLSSLRVLPAGAPAPDGATDDGPTSAQRGKNWLATAYVRCIVTVWSRA